MAKVLTIRGVGEETQRALRIRAAANGRSTEAEIRMILRDAASASKSHRMGSEIHETLTRGGRDYAGVFDNVRRQDGPETVFDE
ncbi:MAG: antitoxin [Bifidobacteriaceae bacterium]|nr:antitoxin [Bifidobacteriaceae bacterium]